MPNCSKNVNDMLLAYVFKLNPIKPHGVYPDMYMYQSRRFSSFRGRQNYIFTLRVEGQPEHWELAAYSRVVPLSNPASGVPWVAYHLGDRIVEQKTGDGLFMAAFNKFSDRLGLNVNPKKALVVFLAGLFLLKLYRESESKATD